MLAGAANGTLTFANAESLYRIASLLIVVGAVLQDVVADTMTAEIVPRKERDGSRPPSAIRRNP